MNLRDARLRLRSLAHRRAVERELAEEMDFHLEMQTRKHIAAGVESAEARERALREFGNAELAKDDARDARGVRVLEEIGQDARFGVRLLRRSPGFALVAIVAIGLAIGINAGFFTLIDAFVWRPIPVARPERLVRASLRFAEGGGTILWSYPQVQVILAHARTLSEVFPEARCANVTFRAAPRSVVIPAAPGCVIGSHFSGLGGRASLGRPLVPADDANDAPPAIVISDAMWTRAFSRAPDVVGRDVVINGTHATVAGVMSPSFIGLRPIVPDLWMTITLAARVGATPGRLDDRNNRFIDVRARLRKNVSRAQGEAELSALVAEPSPSISHPNASTVVGVGLSANDSMLAPTWQTWLVLAPALMVVALVLIIACANLATLMLSRALARQREMAVRLAIGASRARLIRQLLTEGLVIALAGATLGLLLARVTVDVVSRGFFSAVPTSFGTIALDLAPSWRVVAYTVVLAVAAVLSFALAPALQVTSQSVTASLKGEDSALGTRIRRSRFRDALVAAQVAGSLVLLVASGTLIASMRSFGSVAPGLETRRVTIASLGLSAPGRVPQTLVDARAAFDARVGALPTVKATARVLHPPYTPWFPRLAVASSESKTYWRLQYNAVTPSYFTVVQQRLVAGRTFSAADSANGADVAIVTEAAAHALWLNSTAEGQTLRVAGTRDEPDRLYRVIGIVADAHSGVVWDDDSDGYVYLPATAKDLSESAMPILVRSDASSPAMARAIEDVARQIDADAPLSIGPVLSAREVSLTPIRYGTWITSAVGVFGLGLALIGLYGVVAFAVVQRRRDIAVHIALGAVSRDVMRLVLSHELRLVAFGLLVGLLLSAGEARLIAAWLVPLTSLGPVSFAGISLALFLVAFVATLVPALGALRIAPMAVLRQE
jgi:predicted permease